MPERIRSLAATAAPTHVSLAGSAIPAASARGGVDGCGRPVLLVRPGEPLHGLAQDDDAGVTVDLSATRDLGGAEHARGLLKVQGWARVVGGAELRGAAVTIAERCPDEDLFTALERAGDPGAPRLLRVDVGFVIYLTGHESGTLDAEEYLGASPDPFLPIAERLLCHVNEAHRGRLAAAAGRLLGTPSPDAWLWELDRFGATIRSGIDDPTLIRIPWQTPATTHEALEHALNWLLSP
jgi:hypothetical protein